MRDLFQARERLLRTEPHPRPLTGGWRREGTGKVAIGTACPVIRALSGGERVGRVAKWAKKKRRRDLLSLRRTTVRLRSLDVRNIQRGNPASCILLYRRPASMQAVCKVHAGGRRRRWRPRRWSLLTRRRFVIPLERFFSRSPALMSGRYSVKRGSLRHGNDRRRVGGAAHFQ